MKISRWSDLKCHRTSRLGSNVMLGDTKYFNREKALDLVLLYRCRVPEYGSNAYSGDAGLPAIDPSRININTAIICPAIRSSSPQLRLLEENEFSSFRLLRAQRKTRKLRTVWMFQPLCRLVVFDRFLISVRVYLDFKTANIPAHSSPVAMETPHRWIATPASRWGNDFLQSSLCRALLPRHFRMKSFGESRASRHCEKFSDSAADNDPMFAVRPLVWSLKFIFFLKL